MIEVAQSASDNSEEDAEGNSGEYYGSGTQATSTSTSAGGSSSNAVQKGEKKNDKLPFPKRFLSENCQKRLKNGCKPICRDKSTDGKSTAMMYSTPPVIANLPDMTAVSGFNDCNDYYYSQGYVAGYNEGNRRNRDYVQQTNEYSYKFGYNNGWNESNTENREFVDRSIEWYYESGYNKGFNDSNDENCKYTEQSNDYYYEAGYNTGWNESNDANDCYVKQSNDYNYQLGYNTGVNDANRADDEYIEKLSHYYYEYGFNDGFDNCCAQRPCCPPPCCGNSGCNSCNGAPCCNGRCCQPCNQCCCSCNSCCDPCKIYYNLETNKVSVCPPGCSSCCGNPEDTDCKNEDGFNNNKKGKGGKVKQSSEIGNTICIPICCGESNTHITIRTPKDDCCDDSDCGDSSEDCDCCDPPCCYPPVCCFNPCCRPGPCTSAKSDEKGTQVQADGCCQTEPACYDFFGAYDGNNECEDAGDVDTDNVKGSNAKKPEKGQESNFKRFVPYNNMFSTCGGCDCGSLGLEHTTTINRTVKHIHQGERSKPQTAIETRMRRLHDAKKRRLAEIEERLVCLCKIIREAERDLRDAECQIAAARRNICRGNQELQASVDAIVTSMRNQAQYDEDDDECGDAGEDADGPVLPETNDRIIQAQNELQRAEAKYKEACQRRRKALREKEKLEDEVKELRPPRTCVVYSEYIEQYGRRFKVLY